MTWLYVPETYCPSAPASEDLNSASNSLSTISERLAEASVTWRGKEQLPPAWSRRWKQGGFIRLLSGLTCSPSMLDRGVAAFISSLQAIHVRTTALQGSGQDQRASGSSLPKLSASPASAGLMLSSERTYRGMLTDSSKQSSHHWKGWATALRQEYSARPKPEIPCGASDCSSWPSARAEDSESAGRRMSRGVSDTLTAAAREAVEAENWPSPMAGAAATDKNNAAGNSDFSRKAMEQAERMLEWMAPNVPNGGRSTAHAEKIGGTMYPNGQKVQLGLESQAKDWATPQARDHFPAHTAEYVAAKKAQGHGMRNLNDETATWATPAARDHKGSSEGSMFRQDGKSRADLLDCQAEQFFHLPSSPDQPIAGGAMSSTDSPNTNQPSVKRKLNPIFVEALMRWPTGLSGFARQETAWTRWQLLMHSYLSALCSTPIEPEQGSFL